MKSRNVVVEFLESFSLGDPCKVVNHVTDDFKNHQMGLLANSFEGKREYLSRLHPFLNKFKNLRYEIRKVISEDSNVVVEYTLHATPEGHDICVDGDIDLRDCRLLKDYNQFLWRYPRCAHDELHKHHDWNRGGAYLCRLPRVHGGPIPQE